jgi:hypothetical protein
VKHILFREIRVVLVGEPLALRTSPLGMILPRHDEAIRIREVQGPEKHTVHQGE